MTTTTRDAFEAWAYEIENSTTRFERLQNMSSLAMMRATWQAATLAERERCALLCDYQSDCANDMKNTQARLACDELADAIRSGK